MEGDLETNLHAAWFFDTRVSAGVLVRVAAPSIAIAISRSKLMLIAIFIEKTCGDHVPSH